MGIYYFCFSKEIILTQSDNTASSVFLHIDNTIMQDNTMMTMYYAKIPNIRGYFPITKHLRIPSSSVNSLVYNELPVKLIKVQSS